MVYLCVFRWIALAATSAWLVLAATSPVGAEERITIGGAGAHIPVMQAVADAYNARHPSRRAEVLGKALGSSGGIRAVEAGAIAIGLVSRRPHGGEGGTLAYRAYARTPLVVGVHADVPIAGLTASQLCDIFAGRITS